MRACRLPRAPGAGGSPRRSRLPPSRAVGLAALPRLPPRHLAGLLRLALPLAAGLAAGGFVSLLRQPGLEGARPPDRAHAGELRPLPPGLLGFRSGALDAARRAGREPRPPAVLQVRRG